MTFRKLMFLGGLGGLAYWHKNRGGQFTVDSIRQSGTDLMSGIRGKIDTLAQQAQTRIQDVTGRVSGKQNIGGFNDVQQGGAFADDVTGYGTNSDLGYRR
jgi:hypothetical protein